jgi:hypothetical protein
MLRVLSLGAGVQSTTLALLIKHGDVPLVDRAIFADTGAEPRAVYDHLAWLQTPGLLPFPIDVVSEGHNLRDEIMASTRGEGLRGSHARPPFYVLNGYDGTRGMIRRQCTGDYKIDPINKRVRELLGLKPRSPWPKDVRVEQLYGISLDEVTRMRTNSVPTIANHYPLVDLGLRRYDCLRWLERHGYPRPPKSACTFCPYRSDSSWRHLKDTDPEGWQDAVAMDRAIRTGLREDSLVGELYLHASLQPLELVDLRTAAERGQPALFPLGDELDEVNHFENECEGLCGN